MNYGQELPKTIEDQLDFYFKRLDAIKWFQPSRLDEDLTNQQINRVLDAFSINAGIKYKRLGSIMDFAQARDDAKSAAKDLVWKSAKERARMNARVAIDDYGWETGSNVARNMASRLSRQDAWKNISELNFHVPRSLSDPISDDAAFSASAGISNLLASNTKSDYPELYPDGNFLQIIKLWEMGLYPIGLVGREFICYVPINGEKESFLGGRF